MRKTTFFEKSSWFNVNYLGLALGIALKSYTNVAKDLKQSQKVLGANSYICRSYRGKTGKGGRGAFYPLPQFRIELT